MVRKLSYTLPKTSETIHIPSIAGRKRRNVIGPHHFPLRERRYQLIKISEVTNLLDANNNRYKHNNGCHNCVFDSLDTISECIKAVSM